MVPPQVAQQQISKSEEDRQDLLEEFQELLKSRPWPLIQQRLRLLREVDQERAESTDDPYAKARLLGRSQAFKLAIGVAADLVSELSNERHSS